MTKTAASKKTTSKKSPKKKPRSSPLKVNRRREWRFELPLLAKIEGKLPGGRQFKEKTQVENISSTGVYFCLDSGVVIGSKLNLVIEMPKELGGKKQKLKLCIGGLTVRLEELDKEAKKQGVALRFEKKFSIIQED
jgi:c-di-GMP-binding flagellar brake protein YcgR